MKYFAIASCLLECGGTRTWIVDEKECRLIQTIVIPDAGCA